MQPHLRAVGIDLEEDVLELLRRLKLGGPDDRRVQNLAGHGGKAAQLTGRYLHILRLNGVYHIRDGEGIFE